jgi:hypothetical protein
LCSIPDNAKIVFVARRATFMKAVSSGTWNTDRLVR